MRTSPSAISKPGRQVWLLGGLRAEGPKGPINLPGGKPQTLLAYLLLSPNAPPTREQLADLLWPEAPPSRVGRYLSNALYRLHKSLGAAWLDRQTLTLLSEIWVDVRMFRQLAQSADETSLNQAVALYRGDLLPEIYDDWVLPHRVELREQFLTLLERLGRSAEEREDNDAALTHYQRLTQADPFNESGQRGLMRVYARLGRHRVALQHYERFTRLLTDELQTPPLPDTRALAEAIQADSDLKRKATEGRRTWPFVGRVADRALFLERLERARAGNGGLLMVLGEAGIGKTRLLQELDNAARWRGWQVTWGRCEEFAIPAPYAPFSEALHAALPQPRREQLAQLLAPQWLSLVAGLAPESQNTEPVSSVNIGPAQLTMAVGHVLDGLQQIAPQLLILDDTHWADESLWSMLDGLREPLAHLAVLIVVSGRRDELQHQPIARSHLERWDRAGVPLIHLGGLQPVELGELGHSLTPRQLEALRAASGGNPLLALTLLQAGDPGAFNQPAVLAHLFERRLAMISSEARRALEAAAVLGYHFPYAVWQSVLNDPALPTRVGELEQNELLVLESDGYRFAHDTLRGVVYAQIAPPVRSSLHRAVLEVLTRQASAEVLALLHHAEQAGAQAEIGNYAHRAGEQALAGYTASAAVRYFQQALSALPADDALARYAAGLGLARAYDILAEREAQRSTLIELENLAGALKDDARRAQIAWRRASLEWAVGDFPQAQAIAEAGLVLARRSDNREPLAALLETLGRIARDMGDYAQAQTYYQESREVYQQVGDARGEAVVVDALGIVTQRRGQPHEAATLHASAKATFQALGDLFQELRASANLAIALWLSGDLLQAQAMFEHNRRLAHEAGDRRLEQAALTNLGSIAGNLGDYAAAIEFCEQALALARASNEASASAVPLANLADSRFQLGQLEGALATFSEALAVNRATRRKRGEGYALHGRGFTLLELGRAAEGCFDLEAALALRTELGERDNRIDTQAVLALACSAQGRAAEARDLITSALNDLREDDDPMLRQWVHYAAYRLLPAEVARQHLRLAEAAQQAMANTLPAEARERFLQNVFINRQTRAALASLARTVRLRLARADTPLGKALAEGDVVDVHWTVEAFDDEAITDQAERRRHRLKRLLAEAVAQGASPTDGDLAQALGVARRTIERDMTILHQSGHARPTRRRKK